MKDKELKCNASGYYDEPCYKTIQAMDTPKPGEIWTHAATGYYMLIVANQGSICSTLRLTEQEKEGSIPVMCKTQMYTSPIMLGYCFHQAMGQFIKCAKEEEFTAVKNAVADALGIEYAIVGINPADFGTHPHILEEKVKTLEEERNAAIEHTKAVKHEMALMENELKAREKANEWLRKSLEETIHEAYNAGIYKEMYMTLLDKIISARGGSVNE